MKNGNRYNPLANPYFEFKPEPPPGPTNVTNIYENIVIVPLMFETSYGHWINDCLAALLWIPQWVWSLKPVFVSKLFSPSWKLFIMAIGLNDIEIVDYTNEFVYAENIFVCKAAEQWHGFSFHSFFDLKKKFYDYFHLDRVTPDHYYFMNKEVGRRHFVNLKDILDLAIKQTNLNWHFLDQKEYIFSRIPVVFATIRILVCPSGSISFNCLFMHNGTGQVCLSSKLIDLPQLRMNAATQIWTICVTHSEMLHYGTVGYAHAELVIINIKRIIYTVQHQKYPPNDLYPCFDKEFAKEIFYHYGDNFTDYNDWIEYLKNKHYKSLNTSINQIL